MTFSRMSTISAGALPGLIIDPSDLSFDKRGRLPKMMLKEYPSLGEIQLHVDKNSHFG